MKYSPRNIWKRLKTNYFSRMAQYHTHFHFGNDEALKKINKQLKKILKKMAETQAELVQELTALKEQNVKVFAEYTTRIETLTQTTAALEEAISNQDNLKPEVKAALEELKASVQGLDDLTPDATPSEETPA